MLIYADPVEINSMSWTTHKKLNLFLDGYICAYVYPLQTCNDLVMQCRAVDMALKKRVEEGTNAKERLTAHHEKVIQRL